MIYNTSLDVAVRAAAHVSTPLIPKPGSMLDGVAAIYLNGNGPEDNEHDAEQYDQVVRILTTEIKNDLRYVRGAVIPFIRKLQDIMIGCLNDSKQVDFQVEMVGYDPVFDDATFVNHVMQYYQSTVVNADEDVRSFVILPPADEEQARLLATGSNYIDDADAIAWFDRVVEDNGVVAQAWNPIFGGRSVTHKAVDSLNMNELLYVYFASAYLRDHPPEKVIGEQVNLDDFVRDMGFLHTFLGDKLATRLVKRVKNTEKGLLVLGWDGFTVKLNSDVARTYLEQGGDINRIYGTYEKPHVLNVSHLNDEAEMLDRNYRSVYSSQMAKRSGVLGETLVNTIRSAIIDYIQSESVSPEQTRFTNAVQKMQDVDDVVSHYKEIAELATNLFVKSNYEDPATAAKEATLALIGYPTYITLFINKMASCQDVDPATAATLATFDMLGAFFKSNIQPVVSTVEGE